MHNIESYLDRVCRGLGGSAGLRRHLREELREHILDAAARYRAEGASPEEALQRAIADFGEPQALREGLEGVYGRDLMGVLIEKAMQWKENTMKAKWLWSGLASLLLVATIVAQGFFVFSVMWLVVPKLKEMFKDAGQELPGYAVRLLMIADFAIYGRGSLCILALLIVWGLFEWRYRGENRSLIRLSVLAFISLAMMAVVYWAAIVAVVPQFDVTWVFLSRRPEQEMLAAAIKADAAMERLDRATGTRDWPTTWAAAADFRGAFEYGYLRGAAAAGLVTMTQQQRLDEIRDQLRLLTTLAERIQTAPADQMPERNQQMQEAYAKLKVLAGGWPEAPGTQSSPQGAK